MAYPLYLRERAREMRRERQYTINELAERLTLSRSAIAARAIRAKHRLLRDAAYEEGRASFSRLQADPCFRDFVCLYLAEGYKRDRNRVALCNSDPTVIKLADHYIREFARNQVRYSIQYHADQKPAELRAFWSRHLEIDGEAIDLQRKSNSGQLAGRTWRSKHGVLTVRSCDTMFRARLEAWMDLLRASWL